MNDNLKRKLLAGLFVPALGMAVGTALAQGAPGTPAGGTSATGGAQSGASGVASWNAQTFDRLDANHDGKLSREEAQADTTLRGMWEQLDASNRGSVSREDFERFRSAHASGAAGSKAGSTSGMSSGTNAPSAPK